MKERLLLIPPTLLIVLTLISSCGYRIHKRSDLPYTSLRLTQITNRTSEPGLQDLFARVFTEEALQQGLVISETSGNAISILITDYSLSTVAVKNSLSAEYRVGIVADVTIKPYDRPEVVLKGVDSGFDETFVAGNSLQSIQSSREVITKRALRDISQKVLSEIIYTGG